jgi:hypothetical protein
MILVVILLATMPSEVQEACRPVYVVAVRLALERVPCAHGRYYRDAVGLTAEEMAPISVVEQAQLLAPVRAPITG